MIQRSLLLYEPDSIWVHFHPARNTLQLFEILGYYYFVSKKGEGNVGYNKEIPS